jgi:TetR/AcrR family transcriptional regulator
MKIPTDTEQKILQAAREIFLEKGKDGARMQEIADRAGINKALLHYYFRSKDRLFSQVFVIEVKSMFATIFESISSETDFYTFLDKFIRTYLTTISPRRNLLQFILWESEKIKIEFTQSILEESKKRGFKENPLVDLTRKAITNKQIKEIDTINFVLSLLGMCIFPVIGAPIIEKMFHNLKINNPAFLNKRAGEILELIWNGIGPVRKNSPALK